MIETINWPLCGMLFCVSFLTTTVSGLFFYRLGFKHAMSIRRSLPGIIVERRNPYV